MPPARLLGAYVQLALAMIMVGSNIALGKIVTGLFPVMLFSLLRFAVASAILWPLAAREGGLRLRDMKWPLWRDLFLQAFFGVVLYTAFVLTGVRFTSAASAGIITATLPAAVAVFSFLILRERIARRRAIAIVMAVVGIGIVNLSANRGENGSDPFLGNMLVIGAVMSESLFVIFAKRLSARLGPLRMALGLNLVALLQVLPFGLWQWQYASLSSLTFSDWGITLYYIVTASVISLYFWYRGLRQVDAATAGIFTALFPISALAVAILILGESLTLTHVMGAALVLAAIVTGTWPHRRQALA